MRLFLAIFAALLIIGGTAWLFPDSLIAQAVMNWGLVFTTGDVFGFFSNENLPQIVLGVIVVLVLVVMQLLAPDIARLTLKIAQWRRVKRPPEKEVAGIAFAVAAGGFFGGDTGAAMVFGVIFAVYLLTWAVFLGLTVLTIWQIDFFLFDPNRPEERYIKFQPLFKLIENGEAVAVERGKTLRRLILNAPDMSIRRGKEVRLRGGRRRYTEDEPEQYYKEEEPDQYYKAVPGRGEPRFLQLRVYNPFSVYVVLVHRYTQAFWIGLKDYQEPRTYPLSRLEPAIENERPVFDEQGLQKLVPKRDRSDKIIVYRQAWPVILSSVRTNDGYNVNVRVMLYIRITGLYQALYRVDDSWGDALTNAAATRIGEVVRSMSVAEVVFAINEEEARRRLGEMISTIASRVPGMPRGKLEDIFGIELDSVMVEPPRVVDMSDEEFLALTARYRGEQEQQRLRPIFQAEGEGEALVSRLVAEAIQTYGRLGEVVLRMQAIGDAAEAVPEGSIVNLDFGGDDASRRQGGPLDPAILNELRQLSGRRANQQGSGRRRGGHRRGGQRARRRRRPGSQSGENDQMPPAS